MIHKKGQKKKQKTKNPHTLPRNKTINVKLKKKTVKFKTQILKLSDRESKIILCTVVKAVMEELNSKQVLT